MKSFSNIDFGYGDAANYKNNRKYQRMFYEVFVKDEKLERLMRDDTYYLIGDKGTGKTAYAVFLENNEYKNTQSRMVNFESTDYKIFVNLSKMGFLLLSDYTRVWKIILLLIVAQSIHMDEIQAFGPKRSAQFEELKNKIDRYYEHAFVPEITNTFKYVFDNACAAEAGINFNSLGLGSSLKADISEKITSERNIQKFQNNLADMERQFSSALKRLKIKKTKFLFIDSIDIKIDNLTEEEYQACIRGLANAIWEVNTNVFRAMPESEGFLKVVLSIRTDMFTKLNLHNQANKVRDNGVLLDWRTTYQNYRTSPLFKLCNNLLSYQNDGDISTAHWNYYFPWFTNTTNPDKRECDDSFIKCLRLSLSRPRDMISIMKAIQHQHMKHNEGLITTLKDFESDDTQNEISNYYVDEAKDWCLHKFSDEEFYTLIFFFQFLNGKSKFTYAEFELAFKEYTLQVGKKSMEIFEEILEQDDFLQLLYDLNMICYYDKDRNGNDLFRFCYREREIYNLSPKVKTNSIYGVHYALLKALNLGKNTVPDIEF